MKTERRHELQENELANWLGEKIVKIQPYGKTILGVLVLVAVALMVSAYLRGRSVQDKQQGWSAYFNAMNRSDAEGFEEVSKAFPETTAGTWALQRAADLHLDESLRQMFQDRQIAQQELQTARELYEQILKSSNDPMLRQRATFGLAKCLESQGDFEQAEKHYTEVATNWPDSQFANLAAERLAHLKQPATREWYSWFAEQKPVTSPLSDPNMFQDLPNLPESPDVQIPPAGQISIPPATNGGEATSPATGIELPLDTGSNTEGPLELDLGDETPEAPEQPLELDLDLPSDAGADLTPDPSAPSDEPLELELELPSDEPQSP